MGGFILPLVMVYTVLAALIGWGLFSMALSVEQNFARTRATAQAFYAAEAGVENARAYLAEPGRDDWTSAPSTLYTDKVLSTLKEAKYTVTLSAQQRDSVSILAVGTYNGTTRRVRADLTRGY